MIKNFSVTAKPQNNNAKILMWVFFALALICLAVAIFIKQYKGVVGLGTLGFITLAVLVYTKYISVVFHYDIIAEGEDEPLFVVRQTIGKRHSTLCRIALADVQRIERETLKQRREHKSEPGVVKYVYTPTLAPETSIRMSVSSRFERAEIIIEGSDEFIELLKGIVITAKELRPTEDE